MASEKRLPATFAALRHRNFRLFYLGQLLSLVGTWMQDTARGWLVVLLAAPGAPLIEAAHKSGVAQGAAEQQASLYLSVIAIAGSLPVLLGSLYGGILADRYSKRTIIFWAQFTQMILAFLLTGLLATGHVRIIHVVILSLLVGVTNIFDIPARQSFVVEMVGKEDLPNAIALNSSIFNAARAFGPALAGMLLGLLHNQDEMRGLTICFFINGISYVAVLIGLMMMKGDFAPRNSGLSTAGTALGEAIAFFKGHRPALLLILLVTAFSLCVAPYFVLLPSLAKFSLQTDALQFGILMSAQGLGALLAALLMATLSHYDRKGQILTQSSLAFPVLLVLIAVCHVYWIATVLTFLIGFAIISFLATANALLQTSTPDHLRGRVMSVYSLILVGLTPIGSLWSGAVANAAGAPMAIVVGGVLVGIVAIVVALRYPALRRAGRLLPIGL